MADRIAWFEELAEARRIEPSEATARRHLKSLERWRTAPEQWEQLGEHAVLRFARLPSIAELYEIACELLYRPEPRPSRNGSPRRQMSGIDIRPTTKETTQHSQDCQH